MIGIASHTRKMPTVFSWAFFIGALRLPYRTRQILRPFGRRRDTKRRPFLCRRPVPFMSRMLFSALIASIGSVTRKLSPASSMAIVAAAREIVVAVFGRDGDGTLINFSILYGFI